MRNSDRAIEIAQSTIRQINKPTNLSRRRDDWKLDTIVANLETIIGLLSDPNKEIEGDQNGDNNNSGSTGIIPMDKSVRESS